MIIPMANQLIKESIQDLKLNNHKARRKLTGKMLDYYEGENTAKYIEDKFKAEAFREVPPLFINFTHRFINKMARIYRTGAVRNVNDVYSSLTQFKNIKLTVIFHNFKSISKSSLCFSLNSSRVSFISPSPSHSAQTMPSS